MSEPWLKKPKEEINWLAESVFEDLQEISKAECIEFFWVYEQFQKELQKIRKENGE